MFLDYSSSLLPGDILGGFSGYEFLDGIGSVGCLIYDFSVNRHNFSDIDWLFSLYGFNTEEYNILTGGEGSLESILYSDLLVWELKN